jgi:hypothetical protein
VLVGLAACVWPSAPRAKGRPGPRRGGEYPSRFLGVVLQPIALLAAVGQLYADGSGAQGSMVCCGVFMDCVHGAFMVCSWVFTPAA